MQRINSLIALGLSTTLFFSCSSDESEPTSCDPTDAEKAAVVFESNLSLDSWESNEYSGGTYGNPTGWETSNPGTSFLSEVNAHEETSDVVSGSAAKLETIAIGITGIASSTIYTGDFELDISDPAKSAQLGVPFDKRPTSLSFSYKYTPGDNYQQFSGVTGTDIAGIDSCLVYMYLQKRDCESIQRIGTAALQSSETISDWTQKTLDVTYGEISNAGAGFKLRPEETGWANADETPTHVIIVFASSSAGDYFRGALGSLLFVDQISISY
ncbi:PCMD domain-containing protein [Flammeovirga kamogawensis]|uniref:PCMD domain-containing protein n=1 Tax=Flammeovirga kamogawensis TaxID=373891 RepID=A0ABX8GWK5_9BACT|nr:PCMD domain-containing protein [Flammeovirga kamogawensis]MBB6461000.1 hypothetical protein [Flammeovirga kamogawensis]QWG07572.1 PCMD domain-containing protein [Flammeovirga kamogawensis]TRX69384.1 hypothetical protein EO216_15080 [Flammeovirga kamogawensis]